MLACSEQKTEKYDEIHLLLEQNPHKGLTKVKELIKQHQHANTNTKMKLALLLYKAEDKCDIYHTSDSLIKNLYDYFNENGTTGEQLEVTYYMGSTYRDMKNYPLAILYFNKAIEIGETQDIGHCDSMTLANVYSQLSELNEKISNNSLSLYQIRHALEIRQALGIDDIGSYQDVANTYCVMDNDNDTTELFYKKCLFDIISNKSYKEHAIYLGDQLHFFSTRRDTTMANLAFEQIKKIPFDSLPSTTLASMSLYHLAFGNDLDAYIKYKKMSLEKEQKIDNKVSLTKFISLGYINKGMKDSALSYATKCLLLEDSAYKALNAEEVKARQSQFVLEELNAMREEKAKEQIRNKTKLIYILTSVICVLTIFIFILYRQYKNILKYKHQITEIETNKRMTEETLSQYKEIVDKTEEEKKANKHDICLLVKKLEKIETEHCHPFDDEMCQTVFDTVNAHYPTFYEHIITYNASLSNKQKAVIYLTLLGKSQADIARLFNSSRAYVSKLFQQVETKTNVSVEEIINKFKKKHKL